MKKFIILAFLLLILAGVTFAVRSLPWWALLTLGVLTVVGAKFLVGRLLKKLCLVPFKAKGKVLRNARATVHSVIPAATPAALEEDTPEEAESVRARKWFQVEVTIEPASQTGPFQLWEPGDLRLVHPDKVAKLDDIDEPTDTSAIVRDVEIHDGTTFQRDEGMKFGGPQRVRLLVGVQPGVQQARWCYYFESFGDLTFPISTRAAA